jgi:hypothetical protein
MDPIRIMCRVGFDSSEENIGNLLLHNILPIGVVNKTQLIKAKQLSTIVKQDVHPVDEMDPFITLDPAPFTSVVSYNLASIDMFFHVIGHSSGALAPQIIKIQTFAISGTLADSFIEYIQYRNMFSYIYFLEYVNTKNENIDYNRIEQIKSYDTDRYINTNHYIKNILKTDSNGVDVYIIQESLSDVDLLYQIIILLQTLKNDGMAVIKFKFDRFYLDIFTILLNCFDNLSLFKPSTLGLHNDDYYLILEFYKKNRNVDTLRTLESTIMELDYLDNVQNILLNVNEQAKEYFLKVNHQITDERDEHGDYEYLPNKISMFLNIISN